jgi:hypothetical protein
LKVIEWLILNIPPAHNVHISVRVDIAVLTRNPRISNSVNIADGFRILAYSGGEP